MAARTPDSRRSRPNRLNRRRLLSTAAGAGAGALLLACGGQQRPSQPASQSSGAAGTPRRGGQVAVRVTVDPFDWDFSRTGKTIPNSRGLAWAYDSLLGFQAGPKVKYSELVLRPELAQRWESPDVQTYTFHLRQGVKFADLPPVNGRELTSADVKWSYEYWSRSGEFAGKKLSPGQYQWLFEGIDRIETPDQDTAVVQFKEPFAPFFANAASDDNPIVPHEIYDADGSLTKQIAGTGAWQLDSANSEKGSRWVWSRNPTYWDTGKPYLDQINWLVVSDDAATYAAFQSKQLDILSGSDVSDPATADNVRKANPSAVMDAYVDPRPDFLHMNVRVPPLSDIRIRKAIALAIDRDEFVRTQTGGKGAWGLAGAFLDLFTEDEIRKMLPFDPAQAKQLVEQAGYPNGLDLEMTYPGQAYGNYYITEIQLLQAQLKKAGINLVLKSLDKNDYSARRKKGDYVINFLPTQPAGQDIGSLAYAIFYPKQQANYGGVDDPPLTAMLQAQQREPDPAKRKDLIRQAVRRVNAEMFWAQAPYHRINSEFWQPRLQNYSPNFGREGWPLFESWLTT